MARYVLEITSRSGRRLPGSISSTTSVAVYDDDDLEKRLAAARRDSDLLVSVRDLREED